LLDGNDSEFFVEKVIISSIFTGDHSKTLKIERRPLNQKHCCFIVRFIVSSNIWRTTKKSQIKGFADIRLFVQINVPCMLEITTILSKKNIFGRLHWICFGSTSTLMTIFLFVHSSNSKSKQLSNCSLLLPHRDKQTEEEKER